MTNHTEADRAEFEDFVKRRAFNPGYDLSKATCPDGKESYCCEYVGLMWEAWQAARRVPAAPASAAGWKMVPVEPTREMIDAMPPVEETGYFAMYEAALAAAPQPPEAAQSNSTEFEGIKPDAFQTEGGLKSEIRTTSTAPVQMPEPVAYYDGRKWYANEEAAICACADMPRLQKVYTGQQVRQLLANQGIKANK